MLGFGWTEMLLIGIVALVVIGPKELPTVMNRIGKFAATIRRMGSDFQRELNKTTGINEIANLRNSVTAPLKATADAIRKEFNTTTATGEVQPSGALKPADPNAESVVDEIKAAAGMAPAAAALKGPANPLTPEAAAKFKAAEAAKAAEPATPSTSAENPAPPETKPVRVRAARAPKVAAPAVSTPVAVEDIPPAKPARAKKPIESPAPVEAIAPRPRARKAVAAVAPADTPADKPARKKPAATKPAAKKPAADEKP
ncbi:MAG: Sec-independent protein translocase protein TatB [Devosia sp.]|nr:Sec-independent protein translocase protein TatB [Devosia sp.]